MDRDREYSEYKAKLLALGYPEREVDDVLAQMRLEDELAALPPSGEAATTEESGA